MTKIVVSIFAFIALVQVATALNCYICHKDKCEEEMAKWDTVYCGKFDVPNTVTACLKQIYTDKYTNKEVVSRRCILAENDAEGKATFICLDLYGKTSVCDICTTDLCN